MNIFIKLICSSLGVLITSTILNYFNEKYLVDKKFLTLKLDFYANESWTKNCRDYILEFLKSSENDSFTHHVAKCIPICSTDSDNNKILYDPECRTYPLMIRDDDASESRLKFMPYAEATVPCFLNLSKSMIPGANRGIFTKVKLPKGLIFGPYMGVIKSAYGEEGQNANDGGYAWKINRYNEKNEEDDFYIDGISDQNSNWLRYVNSARFEEEQNLYLLMFNDTVYYMTYKEVEPDTELLVWYGRAYAVWLKIETVENSDHDWESDFAPRKDIVICNSCQRSRPSGNETEEHHPEEEEKVVSHGSSINETSSVKLVMDSGHIASAMSPRNPLGTKENLEL